MERCYKLLVVEKLHLIRGHKVASACACQIYCLHLTRGHKVATACACQINCQQKTRGHKVVTTCACQMNCQQLRGHKVVTACACQMNCHRTINYKAKSKYKAKLKYKEKPKCKAKPKCKDIYQKLTFRIDVFYDTSLFKLKKLLNDGDIESNPGPTQNTVVKSPMKGRRKKSKGFRGTPIKQKKCVDENSINFNISSNGSDFNIPLGLLNLGENVCFFNSVIQVLYSITTFREYVLQLTLLRDNPPVSTIKNLFKKIGSSNDPVKNIFLCPKPGAS